MGRLGHMWHLWAVGGLWVDEQIIILRMIYAYCLSLFSVHFFGSHSIANFKLRLINQQTGDCTDSVILHAGKLTPSTFPVPIKLKGGQRLLVKVKLLSLPSPAAEVVMGEGVVTFDKGSIDNTLRVPIYDKQRGVEEVAICSIDFFLSGFQVDKHHSINPDKSRSRFDDLRERTEDAVYSQMSYTLESERDSADANSHSKPSANMSNVSPLRGRQKGMEAQGVKPTTDKKKQTRQVQTIKVNAKEGKISPRKQSPRQAQNQSQDDDAGRKQPNRVQPFTLQNNVYLQQKKSQSNKITLKQTKKKPPSKILKRLALQSEEDLSISENKMELSPQNLRKTVKDNEEVLSKLKKFLNNIQSQESPKHKRRRNKIKVQQFATYKSQNNFLKYHVDVRLSSAKVIKNVRAIRIIQNQIKQPNQQKIIPQLIDKIVLSSLNGDKLVTFDASGFRAYCISNDQKESVATIMIPTLENAVKVHVHLGQEGEFQGALGLQEGEAMNISLIRLSASEQSILERSQFKLLFDIKASDHKPSTRAINYHNNDISYRQPFELIAPDQDIKIRVGQLSCQPWGFIQSYADSVVLSAESKEVMKKIDQQLPRIKEQLKPKALSEPRAIRQPTPIKPRQNSIKKDIQVKSPSVSKQFLDSPIQRPKAKPVASHIRRETDSINSIRNGNRNNYRFQERNSSKQIKQAWEEILFKRKAEEDRRRQAQRQLKYTLKSSQQSAPKRYKTSSDSQNQSLSTFKPKKTHKIYEFAQNDAKRPVFPVRTFTLRVANVSITQPQALVDVTAGLHVGKFVKFAIKGKTMYFTEVIFSGNYNSILWKLEGCVFQGLTGTERLKIEIYETLNNHITTLGISYIRVNRLHFLRNSHIYNGTIAHDNTLFGEFTLGFEVEENCPFQVIREEDEDTIDLSGHPISSSQGRKLQPLSRQSQKNMRQPSRAFFTGLEEDSDDSMERGELQESMSMPMGLSRQ